MKYAALAEIAPMFDAFLIDQFGVLLNGDTAYPWAPNALSKLAALGKPILLLSNSGRRSAPNAQRLDQFGFARDSYMMVLSSGEAAHRYFSMRLGDEIPCGSSIWVHGRGNDTSAVDGLGLTLVEDADEAEFIIIAGSKGDELSLDDYRDMLIGAAERGAQAFCINPDMKMLTKVGQRFGAGRIATLYEELGGPVHWIGKPYPLIYEIAKDILKMPQAARVLCIGDSPDHDIQGGLRAGFETALVRTGLYADLSDGEVEERCRAIGAMPNYVIPSFDM